MNQTPIVPHVFFLPGTKPPCHRAPLLATGGIGEAVVAAAIYLPFSRASIQACLSFFPCPGCKTSSVRLLGLQWQSQRGPPKLASSFPNHLRLVWILLLETAQAQVHGFSTGLMTRSVLGHGAGSLDKWWLYRCFHTVTHTQELPNTPQNLLVFNIPLLEQLPSFFLLA